MTSISAQPGYGLYPHQRQVANDLMRYLAPSEPSGTGGALAERRRRVVAHLPTGAGKTRVATHVAAGLLNCSQHDDRGLVIWLANTEELCEQAAEELERAWYYLGRWDAAVHRLWGNPPLLGLTATPGRGTVLDADDTRLVELFHSNKVSIDPKGHPNAVAFLIEGEYLAFPVFQQVSFESEASDVEGSVDGDYSSVVLAHIPHINPAGRAVISNMGDRCNRIAELSRYHEC